MNVPFKLLKLKFSVSLQNKFHTIFLVFFVKACGGGRAEVDSIIVDGFPASYLPPSPSFDPPESIDPNFKFLEPVYVDPYWTKSLLMMDGEEILLENLIAYDRKVFYNFPKSQPDYFPVSILGWKPANEIIISASREIFNELEKVLDVKFEETQSASGVNIIALSQSIQSSTAGLSFLPSNFSELGSDVFISVDYANPKFLTDKLTNYDFEVLIHEIGHALGLKHPFEGHLGNETILNSVEDQTSYTLMSYESHPSTFDGKFRVLDWMALTELYGVNSVYRPSDDVYFFNDSSGVFIVDGNGVDKIDATSSQDDIYIDLRSGSHSYKIKKSTFITDANQMTISHGTIIENVETGSGNDHIIGNYSDNIIISASGDDNIFPSEGKDLVFSGDGRDIIDFSEDLSLSDTLVLDVSNENGCDIVLGFTQGAAGDIFHLINSSLEGLKFLPLVDLLSAPAGTINNSIVRIFGSNLDKQDILLDHFFKAGLLGNLTLNANKSAVIITSNSQQTGEDQNVYMLSNVSGFTEINHIAELIGNYLDIDVWAPENFII